MKSRIMHAIEISKRDGRSLLSDKEGPVIFSTKIKAADYLRAIRGSNRIGNYAKPEIVKVLCKIEKVK